MPGTNPAPARSSIPMAYALRCAVRARRRRRDRSRHRCATRSRQPPQAIRRARDAGADILVTTGGASVGDHDLVQPALEAEGIAMAFWRIAMRPGKPMMHGRLGRDARARPARQSGVVLCLRFLFLVPLIRALSGRRDVHHVREPARLGRDLPPTTSARTTCARRSHGGRTATSSRPPYRGQDSSLLGHLAGAQAAPHSRAVRAGGLGRRSLRDHSPAREPQLRLFTPN